MPFNIIIPGVMELQQFEGNGLKKLAELSFA